MSRDYQICVSCVMDTSDPGIRFDPEGICNYCRAYEAGRKYLYTEEEGQRLLRKVVTDMKRRGQGRDYDCIMGLSGGVDSSYAAFKVAELGLRPLVVHFDSGWNSELSVRNIENIVKRLGLDLYTVVCDWEEMRDLQRSFFLASLVNCDIPQDHAFIAVLYQIAVKHGIKYWVGGHNTATESIMAPAWRGYTSQDWRHIVGVHRAMGGRPLGKFPHYTFLQRYVYYPWIRGIRPVNILEYMPYVKADAKLFLEREVGWRDYGGKHCESVFTRFFQGHYLPEKYGYDKRRAHLSSLIVSGQMSRDAAFGELTGPPYTSARFKEDKVFVLKKLGFSEDEWTRILALPPKTQKDYPNGESWFGVFKVRPFLHRVKRTFFPRRAPQQ